MSASNSSGWRCSNITILILYVSESASYRSGRILLLMISHLLTLSVSLFICGIGRGSIYDWTTALSQTGERFVVVYPDGLGEL